MADAGNKCRNPYTSDKYHPWCYTADDGSTWGYCEITLCSKLIETILLLYYVILYSTG